MIVTILLIGLPLGLVVGVTRRFDVLALGTVVTIVGWWILFFTAGGGEFTVTTAASTTLAAFGNLAVGTTAGWLLGRGTRELFGMTAER